MKDSAQPAARTVKERAAEMLLSVMLLAGLWWVLTNGSIASWLIGVPALAGAGWASQRLSGPSSTRISLRGLVRFVPFFFWRSLRGGVDVVLRTLSPVMRIQPGFIRYRTGLKAPAARTFFVNCVSLLPGTLAADLQAEWLEVHVINGESAPNADLARLERVVAGLFADTMETS